MAADELSASEFRFNAWNTPNHDIVGRILDNPQFGVVQSQLAPRQIQLGLRLAF